jgi:predicted hotdog family 3-hydroxylacyl-ACP dehydratase
MLCIDALTAASETQAESVAHLAWGHILLEQDAISEVGYIELAAQTAGAMKGYWEKIAGRPISDGYLAAVQNFTVFDKAFLGETVSIHITLLMELSGVRLIEAEIKRLPQKTSGNTTSTLLASGKLKLFLPEASPEDENKIGT